MMRNKKWYWVALIVCIVFLWPENRLRARSAAAQEQEIPKECCYIHDGYQGVCKVTPAEGETCETILEYLNNPASVGKSYCGGSKLRGGWQLVECEREEEEPVER